MGSFRAWRMPCEDVAYMVDLSGAARAIYGLDCQTGQEATRPSDKFLNAHLIVMAWDGPAGSLDCGESSD